MNLVRLCHCVAIVLYLLTSAALTVRLAGAASGLRMSRGYRAGAGFRRSDPARLGALPGAGHRTAG